MNTQSWPRRARLCGQGDPERRRQDNLSLIKVVRPELISAFVEEFAKLVR